MKFKVFRPFVCLIVFAVLFSGFGNIQAEEEKSVIKENPEVSGSFSHADVTESKVGEISKVNTSFDDEEASLDTTLTNNFETGEINLNGKIANSEEEENIDYSIDLTYADENDIAGYLIDNKTGEEHPFDTRLSEASAVPLVVVAVMAARFGVKWAIKKYGKKAVNKAVKSNTHHIAKSINKSLLNKNGVDIGKFTQKVKGKNPTWKDPKTKWTISKNKGEPHGGSYWKLLNNKGKRIASLTKEGKILRK
ncbi:SAR2788 family putative toxin [Mammaliicoccus sciuri]|uniref:SAR2788 family putative toxin n=1 Tax=Mammaliicoccus sciuri TaxID=1296 RepID=UPI001E57620C|nr:SAR2788 family putative toxin [Mammaliicoccus sciuri]MCD8861066.1 SAR2788 family putative toxin [Mammaliicoccus sciuri]MCD8897852.1 SAR2788 family putative toxin [Mammaliicoccus sciuri]MEB6231824.1 SAR2788 family putative toxin [Mammaliicoccus sciuri]